MTRPAKRQETGIDSETVQNLTMMLDCAIADGARLRLPMFVWLVRLARIELINSTEGNLAAPGIDGREPGASGERSGNR